MAVAASCSHAAGRLPDFDARYAKAGQAPPPPPPPAAAAAVSALAATRTGTFSAATAASVREVAFFALPPPALPRALAPVDFASAAVRPPSPLGLGLHASPATGASSTVKGGLNTHGLSTLRPPPAALAWSLRRRCRAARRRG